MKKRQRLLNLIQEVAKLITNFFKPCGLQDPMLKIPKNVQQMGLKVGFMNLSMTFISLSFAFLLKITNMMIEYKLILLGIMCFMLYRGQQVVREAFWLFQDSTAKKFNLIFEDEIVLRGSQLIGKVADKVLKFDQSNKLYKVMNNESILNAIKNYLQNFWYLKIQYGFELLEMIGVVAMLIVAIITNTAIPQTIFIPLIIVFALISFFSSAYISISRDSYYEKHRGYNNEQTIITNDLLRVPLIVKGDLDMRINKLQKSVIESNKNITSFHRKMNVSRLAITIIEAFSQYGIIIFYLLGVEWNNITVATIAEITATLLIAETALGYIGRTIDTLARHNERLSIMTQEEPDIKLILNVYNKEISKNVAPKRINSIDLKPFSIKYLEESENDRPFVLTSQNNIFIANGTIVILYGPSASGKSTLMKVLLEKIKFKKSSEIPSTSRFLFYDEKLKFGSLSIYEEIFCCSQYPDHAKMQSILENLHLWTEIKSNCFDVWQWMKEKKYGNTLSKGQNQRLILAKMLYWLDDSIDVVVLDECTSGLDDKSETDSADAERVLEYIVNYCNQDKQRIIILATHQNIDGFKERLKDKYLFKDLYFTKKGDSNIVTEI